MTAQRKRKTKTSLVTEVTSECMKEILRDLEHPPKGTKKLTQLLKQIEKQSRCVMCHTDCYCRGEYCITHMRKHKIHGVVWDDTGYVREYEINGRIVVFFFRNKRDKRPIWATRAMALSRYNREWLLEQVLFHLIKEVRLRPYDEGMSKGYVLGRESLQHFLVDKKKEGRKK